MYFYSVIYSLNSICDCLNILSHPGHGWSDLAVLNNPATREYKDVTLASLHFYITAQTLRNLYKTCFGMTQSNKG